MEKIKVLIAGTFLLTALAFFLFSYLWVDFGLVLMLSQTRPYLAWLLNLIGWRETNRELLGWLYLTLLIILVMFQLLFLSERVIKKLSLRYLLVLAGLTSLIFSFSYPFLSSDIFSYLFSAKMLWVYHANPYRIPPKEFMANDLWLSFMRNIQFTYAYGPLALVYSLIPMVFFGGKRFILNFFGLKLMNAIVFYLAGLLLLKTISPKRLVFSIWFFNPLLLVEFLANSHNDLVMIALFFLFVFYLGKDKKVKSLMTLVLSILVKYVSIVGLPIIFLSRLDKRKWYYIFKIMSLGGVIFLGLQKIRGVQPWYYTWIYMWLPFSKLKGKTWAIISLVGLLLLSTYFPFVRSGFWGGSPLISHFQFWFYFLIFLSCFSESSSLVFNYLRMRVGYEE